MHENIPIGDLIFQKLKEKGRSLAWLAQQVGCDASNLSKTLKNSRYVYSELLFRISIALDEDFFACYSQKLKEMKKTEKSSSAF